MALIVKQNTKVAVELETVEGQYEAPSTGSSFVQPLSDGLEIAPAKELIERSIFNGSLGKSAPRTSTRSVTGTVPLELKAGETEGAAPEMDKLLQAAMGDRRQSLTEVSIVSATTSSVTVSVGDAANFAEGDVIHIKEAGAHHVSPLSAVDALTGEMTLAIPMAAATTAGTMIAAMTTYHMAEKDHKTLSISKYMEDSILETAVGCRVSSMALNNFTTGQLSDMAFSVEGLDFDQQVVAGLPVTPVNNMALPPVILNARVFLDGQKIEINEFTLSMENTLGFVTSTCSERGRLSSRVSERSLTGTFNPFKSDSDVDNFQKFKDNSSFSILAYAANPGAAAGELQNVIAIWLPQCSINELAQADLDGVVQETITFQAHRSLDGSKDELFLSFS